MVYPKIGNQGEFYHYHDTDPFQKAENIGDFRQADTVIANHRYSYVDDGELRSKYVGDSIIRNQLKEKPLR
jgi:hypothetical protein